MQHEQKLDHQRLVDAEDALADQKRAEIEKDQRAREQRQQAKQQQRPETKLTTASPAAAKPTLEAANTPLAALSPDATVGSLSPPHDEVHSTRSNMVKMDSEGGFQHQLQSQPEPHAFHNSSEEAYVIESYIGVEDAKDKLTAALKLKKRLDRDMVRFHKQIMDSDESHHVPEDFMAEFTMETRKPSVVVESKNGKRYWLPPAPTIE